MISISSSFSDICKENNDIYQFSNETVQSFSKGRGGLEILGTLNGFQGEWKGNQSSPSEKRD